jgi:hypothetical protein
MKRLLGDGHASPAGSGQTGSARVSETAIETIATPNKRPLLLIRRYHFNIFPNPVIASSDSGIGFDKET